MTSAYLDRPMRSLAQAVRDRRRRGTLDLTTARALVADRDLMDALNSDAPVRSPLGANDLGGALSRC